MSHREISVELPRGYATNCDACGNEYMSTELEAVLVHGMTGKLNLCKRCSSQDTVEDFVDVVNLVQDVVVGQKQG